MTEKLREAAFQALEAWDDLQSYQKPTTIHQRIEALRNALAEPEPMQEPVAWLDQDLNAAYTAAEMDGDSTNGLVPLYAAPPQRPPLTDEEIDALALEVRCDPAALRSAIERKVRGEKE